MKKFIKDILLFSGSLIILFLIVNKIAELTNSRTDLYQWKYNELFHPKIKAKIVILGSSKATRNINPKLIETPSVKAFSFGFDGADPQYIYNWDQLLLKKHYPSAKLAIVNIDWFQLKDFEYLTIEDQTRYFPFSDFLNALLKSDKRSDAFYNHFYWFCHWVGKGGAINKSYHGYTPYLHVNVKKSETIYHPVSAPANQIVDIKKLLHALHEQHIKTIAVLMPGSPSLKLKGFDKDVERLKTMIKNEGDSVLDYRQLVRTDSLFHDPMHLTEKGAQILSTQLKKDISRVSTIYQDNQ